MRFRFPKVYPILDSSRIPNTDRAKFLLRLGCSLAESGVTLLEYRNKCGPVAELIADAGVLRAAMPAGQVKLILDDRVDLIELIGFDGVHLDAGDLSPAVARRLLGQRFIIGTFGGSDVLLPGILEAPADYFAIGPVYATTTKKTDKPPIGPEGVRRLREQGGPVPVLTAAAGITLETAPLVLDAGATAVAVSEALFRQADPAAEFRRWMAELA
jgi:thiamine-phosphate pyrophosphorylase